MDDDPSASTDGKSLTNLRVIDLKQELEKRGLSKSGSKKDLVKRLKQQIEFEKLCEERKSTGDRDLKLGLDAVTEQNEFVQQYLAQQQKIYAEQQEVKRLVELEEIQKSGDERESCEADSLGEENEEKSVSSSETEEQNKNECNEKCDTTSGESAEPSSSETVSQRNSDDFIHIEVLQEESLTNTRVAKEPKSPDSQNSEENKESKSTKSQSSKEMKESNLDTSQNSEEIKEPSTTLESDDQTDSIQTKSHIVLKRSKRESTESSSQSSDSSPERKVYAKRGENIKSLSLNCRVAKEPKSPDSQNSEENKESKSTKSQSSKEMKESILETSQNSEEIKEPSTTLVNEAVPIAKVKNNEEKLSLPVSISSRRLKLKRNNIASLETKNIEIQIKDDSTQNQSMNTTLEVPQKEPDKSEPSQKKPSHEKIRPPQDKHEPSHEKIRPPQNEHEPSQDKIKPQQDKHEPSHDKIKPPQEKHEPSQEKIKQQQDKHEPSHEKIKPQQDQHESSDEKIKPSQDKHEPSQEKLETSMENLEHSQEQAEPSQEKPNSLEKPVEPIMPKMTHRKLSILSRKLNRKSSEEDKSEETGLKKSRWGSYTSSLSRSSLSISSDSLKKFIPDFKLITGPISSNDMDDPFNSVFPGEPSPVATEPKLPNFTIAKEVINEEAMEESSKLVESKPLPVQKEHEPVQRPIKCPSPQGPVSKIVFIQNLVRPFTLLQLKELLRQTGQMVEESFWTDRIKSKCFVEYETEEEALKTRESLNGARWPSSNPKILSVEFATQEELDQHKNGSEGPHTMSQRPIPTLTEVRDTRTVLALPAEDHRKNKRDHRKEVIKTKPQLPMREWDKDKISQETPERERGIVSSRERERGTRSAEKKDKKDSKRRTNEDTPAKLLDDLFQKTKSSPCIYWLPLTEEQVKQKEEDRRLRMLAREKKNQQKEEEETVATTTNNRRTKNRPPQKGHDKESRRSQTRSRSPVTRRR